MNTKDKTYDFELEIDSRDLTSDELTVIKDFIRRDKEKNIEKLKIQKTILKRKINKISKV